jgi:hypothetical protein
MIVFFSNYSSALSVTFDEPENRFSGYVIVSTSLVLKSRMESTETRAFEKQFNVEHCSIICKTYQKKSVFSPCVGKGFCRGFLKPIWEVLKILY